MQVNSVQSTNFEAKTPKQRFISNGMKDSLEAILTNMNNETSIVQEGDYFKSTIITKLHFNKSAIFEDERRLTKKVSFEKQMQGFSNLKIGKNIILDIDNKTGEIIDCVKPFFKPFKMVIKKAENVLNDIRTNFNIEQVVKKDHLTIKKLTSEGNKKMKKYVLEFEKQRLEEVIKELEKTSK